MTGGPYREGGTGLACPAGQVVLLTVGGWRLTCVKGCGEWWHKDGLERAINWRVVEVAEPYRLFGYVAPELSCPDCARTMPTRLRAKILFAHCDDHGLWLPREGRAAFGGLGGWAKLLAALQKERGMSILQTSHDLGVVAETCAEVIVMYAGRIVEQAPAAALFATPHHHYTAGLTRSVPALGGAHDRLQEIPGMVPSLHDLPKGCKFAGRCPAVQD